MSKTTILSVQVREYVSPRLELCGQVTEDLLCDSPSGYTENIGDVDDFTW